MQTDLKKLGDFVAELYAENRLDDAEMVSQAIAEIEELRAKNIKIDSAKDVVSLKNDKF